MEIRSWSAFFFFVFKRCYILKVLCGEHWLLCDLFMPFLPSKALLCFFFFFYRTFGVSTRKKKSCKTLLKYNRVSYKWINILSYFLATASFPPSTFSRTAPPPPTPGDPRPAFHSLRSAPGHHTSAGFPSLARRSHRGSRRERRSARRPSVPRLGGSSARNSDKWTGAGRTEQL